METGYLKEIRKLLKRPYYDKENCVSLYEVINLLKKENMRICDINNQYIMNLNIELRKHFKEKDFLIGNFDYINNCLYIGICRKNPYFHNYHEKYILYKNENNLYIKKVVPGQEPIFKDRLLLYFGELLNDFYDYSLSERQFIIQNSHNIKSVNSNFLININFSSIEVLFEDFNIKYICKQDLKKKKIDKNSIESNMLLKNNKEELFKRIFVEIDSCPKWMREALYKSKINTKQRKKQK